MATSAPLSLSQQDCNESNQDAEQIEISNLLDPITNERLLTNNSTGETTAIKENTNGQIPEDNSAKDTKTCCFRFCSTTPTKEFEFTVVDFGFLLLSLVTYIADMGSDIWVAFRYYKNGDIWWMALTLLFVIAPCVIAGCFLVVLVVLRDNMDLLLHLAVAAFAPISLIFNFIVDLCKGWKIIKEKCPEKKNMLSKELIQSLDLITFPRLFEAFLEAAPQLVLQLYIMFSNHAKSDQLMVALQWGSVLLSLASLSWALTSFYKTNRLIKEKYKVSLPGVLLVFLFHVFTIGARVLSLALFAAYSGYAVPALTGIHYIIMLLWSLSMETSDLCDMDCDDFAADAVFAFIFIFCFCNKDQINNRLRYAFFYTLMYIENVGMLLVWYFTTQPMYEWHRYLACAVIICGFFIGILCLVVYYVDLHPNNLLENPKNHIKVWIPFSKLKLMKE